MNKLSLIPAVLLARIEYYELIISIISIRTYTYINQISCKFASAPILCAGDRILLFTFIQFRIFHFLSEKMKTRIIHVYPQTLGYYNPLSAHKAHS